MKNKRLLSAIIAGVLLLCLLFCAVGCDKGVTPEKHKYTITIVDGENRTTAEYEDGYSLILEDLTKDGFEFLGYYVDGVKIESPYTVNSDADIIARYRYGTLGQNLMNSLKLYLESEEFEKSIANAKTASAWLPLAYLRYVDGEFYTASNAATFKKYLNMLDELIVDGKISDNKWYGSAASAQGWYGITDYLYTYAIALNAYKEYLNGKGLTDNTFDIYNAVISDYLEKVDNWLSHNTEKYDILGEEVSQANLYYTAYNQWNRFSISGYEKLGQEKTARLLECVAEATGSNAGHEKFLSDYAKLEPKYQAVIEEQARIKPEVDALKAKYDAGEFSSYSEYYNQLKEVQATQKELETEFLNLANDFEFMSRFKSFMPITQVSFGMSVTAYLAIIKANLSLDANLAYVDNSIMARYEKDEQGNFVKEGGTPNWVGPTGAPIAASLYRDKDWYDVNFEKYRQGYFPFTDGWNHPLSELITLDLYGKYYNHTLTTGANVTPQWGLLTGYMHGIDMENYVVGQPVEGEPTEYNIISLWLDNLDTDENGNYIIKGNIDMAVAICYLASINGIEAPTPLGVYNSADKVIEI
ncbi:MAG: hypothetical protein K2M36_04305 [Clostridia bacterium]|nr:hypothetical protein [Clostridia bacterium]